MVWGREEVGEDIRMLGVTMMRHGQKVPRGKDGRRDENERRYVCILALVTGGGAASCRSHGVIGTFVRVSRLSVEDYGG